VSAREAIAAAASTVDGITVTPYFRQVATPGQGHVRLAQSAPDSKFPRDFVDTWEVVIPLVQDIAAAEKRIDSIRNELLSALAAEMHVVSLVPTELVFDTGSVPGVVITGTREG
jgi:hypothetical protein